MELFVFLSQILRLPSCVICHVSKNIIHFSRIEPHTFTESLKLPVPTKVAFTTNRQEGIVGKPSQAQISHQQMPKDQEGSQCDLPMRQQFLFKTVVPRKKTPILIILLLSCCASFCKMTVLCFCTYITLYQALMVSFKCIFILILGHMVCSFVTIETSWSWSKVI